MMMQAKVELQVPRTRLRVKVVARSTLLTPGNNYFTRAVPICGSRDFLRLAEGSALPCKGVRHCPGFSLEQTNALRVQAKVEVQLRIPDRRKHLERVMKNGSSHSQSPALIISYLPHSLDSGLIYIRYLIREATTASIDTGCSLQMLNLCECRRRWRCKCGSRIAGRTSNAFCRRPKPPRSTPCIRSVGETLTASEWGGNNLNGFQNVHIEKGSRQGQNLAFTGSLDPSSLDRGSAGSEVISQNVLIKRLL